MYLEAPPSEFNNAPPPPTFMSRLWSYLPFVTKPAPKRNTRLDKLPRNDIRRLVQIREPETTCRCYTREDGIRVVFSQCRHVEPIHPAPVPVLEILAEPVLEVPVAPVELAPVVVAPVVELAPVVVAPVVELAPVRRHKRRTGPKITTLEPVYGPEPASAPAPIVPTIIAVEQTSEVHGPIIPSPCKFGQFCKRADCWFTHPDKKPCNYGENCRNERCTFAHPQATVAAISQYSVVDAATVYRGPKKAPGKKQRPVQVPMVSTMTLPNTGMSWANTM